MRTDEFCAIPLLVVSDFRVSYVSSAASSDPGEEDADVEPELTDAALQFLRELRERKRQA